MCLRGKTQIVWSAPLRFGIGFVQFLFMQPQSSADSLSVAPPSQAVRSPSATNLTAELMPFTTARMIIDELKSAYRLDQQIKVAIRLAARQDDLINIMLVVALSQLWGCDFSSSTCDNFHEQHNPLFPWLGGRLEELRQQILGSNDLQWVRRKLESFFEEVETETCNSAAGSSSV